MNAPRIHSTKQWALNLTTLSGHRYSYEFDTEADADVASAMLFAHRADILEIEVTPLLVARDPETIKN